MAQSSDKEKVQAEDKDMPTRMLENGTKIALHFGDVSVPATLNGSSTARAFIETLPRTINLTNYGTDHCGLMEELPYNEADVHFGWLNGDIDYATDGPWFVVFFGGEKRSSSNGFQVNIGKIDCPLSTVANLSGSNDVRIELA